MSTSRHLIFSAYRKLNRARIELFRGDAHAMAVTHQTMRGEFERNKYAPTSGPEFETLLSGIDEATMMLKHEIIRGSLNEDTGRYGTYYMRRDQRETSETTRGIPLLIFYRFLFFPFLLLLYMKKKEMKIKREHVAGSAVEGGGIKPEVELITEDTVKRMENPTKVEVCKSSSSGKK